MSQHKIVYCEQHDYILRCNRVATASISKPIHNVKEECLRIPISARCRTGVFISGKTGSWWSQSGSNRRPQACKASALPTELWPHWIKPFAMVGRVGVEPTTSRLSGVRSNHLSYRPPQSGTHRSTTLMGPSFASRPNGRRRREPAQAALPVRGAFPG